MRRIVGILILAVLLISPSVAYSAENLFKKYNPDVDKYAFGKSFIAGLSYYNRVAVRLQAEAAPEDSKRQEAETVRVFIDDRTMDNTELRIAKNYITKFSSSANGLIQKIARQTEATYDRLIAMSIEERGLWQIFYRFKTEGVPADFNEADFVRQQAELAAKKKEIAKGLLEASMLLRTVFLSAEKCESEDCKALALTSQERDRLVAKLDAFAKSNIEWGAKAGQTTIEACVAAVREVLEDSAYQSREH